MKLAADNAQRAAEEHLARQRAVLLQLLGPRATSKPVTELQAAAVISAFLLYNSAGEIVVPTFAHSRHARAKVAAFMSGRSESTAKKLWDLYNEHGFIVLEEPGERGPRRPSEEELMALEPLVRQHVREELMEKGVPAWVTRKSLAAFIFDVSGIEVSLTTLLRLTKAWGLSYERLVRPPHAFTAKRSLQRDVAVCQVFMRWQQGCYILSADESFCNVRENRDFSFVVSGSPFATFARAKGAGLGLRLCYIHALGRCGLAGIPDDLDEIMGDTTSVMAHCEMIFEAKKGKGDYHGNFDHTIFMLWVVNRFIPWALANFPALLNGEPGALDAKVVLMLDNAPYHIGSTENLVAGDDLRFNPQTTVKKSLFLGMELAGCESLDVEHTYTPMDEDEEVTTIINVPISAASAALRGKKGVFPNAEEVKLAAFAWLVDNCPMVLENDVEHELRVQTNGNAIVLWNAPNFPEFMPVEMGWGQVKAYAGAVYTGTRNMSTLAQDVHDALYTDKEAVPGVLNTRGGNFVAGDDGECPSAAALFRHAYESPSGGAMAHIKVSTRLEGSLATLVTPDDLEDIVNAPCRNVMLFMTGQLIAAEGEALGAALEEEEEEEEEGADDE